MGRFKKGLVLGGIVGAGLMWLNATVKGKEYRAKLIAHLEPLYNELKESIMKLEGPTREMWDALVERAVEEYSAKKELAVDVKNNLIRELQKRWCKLEKEIRNG
ncbi:MAG: YtxH domain-containing protein [Candidatus Magasanikbacteria bacterium]|nr:YtxH domain-containing protein [Candidatus Magasanikbacteria bacterium]